MVFKREAHYIGGNLVGHTISYSQPKTNSFPNGKFFLFPTTVQEFAFEGTSDEKESRPKSEPFFTIDGQLGMLKNQISEMNARIEKLEKIIESKF